MLLLWIQILSIQAVSVCNFYAAFIFAACCRNRIIAGQFINVIANRAKRNVELIRKVFHCVLFSLTKYFEDFPASFIRSHYGANLPPSLCPYHKGVSAAPTCPEKAELN